MENNILSPWKDKALFTPGPLTAGRTVKQAMLRAAGGHAIRLAIRPEES